MLKEYILSDFKRCGIQKISIKVLFSTFYLHPNPGLKFMTIFRLTQHYRRKNRLLFYFFFLWLRRLKVKYGFDISYRTQIGKGFYIGHFGNIVIHGDTVIGENCNLGQNVVVSPNVILGENVKVQNNVSIYSGVICEDDVFLGPSMVFTNVINPRSAIIRRGEYQKTLVKKGASIGANATILAGIKVGEYAMIGAGSVVVKDVPKNAVVAGNPAKILRYLEQ